MATEDSVPLGMTVLEEGPGLGLPLHTSQRSPWSVGLGRKPVDGWVVLFGSSLEYSDKGRTAGGGGCLSLPYSLSGTAE